MGLFRKIIYSFLLFLLISHIGLSSAFAVTGEHPVLIISSYNPDARQTSGNIYDFMEEFERLGGKAPIALENMNCKSFSEAPLWKNKMEELLAKYRGKRSPVLLVLIGQEAWTAYLSQADSIRGNVPVLAALASRNAIILPDDSVDLKTWMPNAVDFFNDFPNSSVKAGFVYEYDVEANINLIKKLYPKTRNIAFVSDNSYGGVSLQAHVVEEMKKHPELNLILLDGRTNTIYTISDKLHELPPNTALLLGTWRVDMYDGYFMRNATYTMMEAAGDVPTFSITSVGIGYWAVGGVIPSYRALGKDMAHQAVRLLQGPDSDRVEVEVIPNKVQMDSKIVKDKRLDLSFIHQPIEMVNENPSFYEQYKYHIWTVGTILVVLLSGLFISLYFYYHTKKLKDELEESESALREAKDRAEESSRLKSAFLANMSHEIRTPLNAIVGFSDVLASGGTSVDEQQGYVDIIKTNSDLLLRLINDILDVSRLEADRVTFTIEKCDVVPLCQQVLASVSQARKSENKYIFECDRESVDLRTDTQRLQQVIINLLSNADKFTRNGKITLKLEVDEEKRVATFSVSDTGTGIPLEKQKLVFERFEKLNEYVQGTGLGLSICKLTVEKWGGEIWVDPGYTDGARFVFTHPFEIEQPNK
ncbi:sensor histidine kinase [Bacteroides intestinalis]|uniref:histidine kinase n=1 Tax=Bacteroides intestinalis TaxID=329854 RepID=A0A412XQL5_9BACE|nr:HAMP domain-containing sensor histidine kinase [Bacteroides intestinalis]RGV47562.1 sensor histidine kinase [Bacteroides intestinalis]RHA53125.1 sensor histidine kinase [Bacteroides intestinalis]